MVHSYCGCERWGGLTKTFLMLIYIETNQRASHFLLNSNWLLCERSIYLYEGCRVAWSIASKWRALVPFILVISTTRPPTKIKKCNIYKCMNIYIIICHYEYIYYKRNILPLPQNISHIMIIFKRSKMKQADKFWDELISLEHLRSPLSEISRGSSDIHLLSCSGQLKMKCVRFVKEIFRKI